MVAKRAFAVEQLLPVLLPSSAAPVRLQRARHDGAPAQHSGVCPRAHAARPRPWMPGQVNKWETGVYVYISIYLSIYLSIYCKLMYVDLA